MDTIMFRINGIDKFRISSNVQFNQDFTIRTFNDLSQKERIRSKTQSVPYVRQFILKERHPDGLYLPSVEVYEKVDFNRALVFYEMRVTCSLPTLLLGTGLWEITPADRSRVSEMLRNRLGDIGIYTIQDYIERSAISVVHFCKNILLPKTIQFRGVLKELSRVDVGKAYNTTEDTRKKNQNNNEVLHLYCGTREWSFYEKLSEISTAKRKSVSSQKAETERELVESFDFGHLEIFRYEYRLKKSQTIKSELNKILLRPFDTVVTFNDLFTAGLWKSVLGNSWKKIVDRPENQLALFSLDNELDLLLHILAKVQMEGTNAHSQNKALWSYGLAMAIKEHGVKMIRQEFTKIWSEKASETRFDEKLAIAGKLIEDIPLAEGVLFIGKELERFEPITLEAITRKI